MKYVSLIIAVLIIELFIIIGCFIARWKNKNNVDVDHRRKIEDITLAASKEIQKTDRCDLKIRSGSLRRNDHF